MGSSGEPWFEVIVVGGGIMGSCTAYETSKRGYSTLLIEQFDLLHTRGSSHGESRTLRITYPEHYYPSLVLESSRLWDQAQAEIGYRVLYPTSQLDIGPADDLSLQAVLSSCLSNSVGCRVLDPLQLEQEFSGRVVIPEGWIGVVSEGAAVIKPTKAVAMFQALALRHGALLRDNMQVTTMTKDGHDGGISVSTATGEKFRGKKCVVTAGPWMKKLVEAVTPGHQIPIQPLETTICYWRIKQEHDNDYTIKGGFPSFAGYGNPYIYGTPSLEYPGLIKIAVHGGRSCDPDRRTWAPRSDLMELLRKWVADRFRGRVEDDGPVSTQSCIYSMTPDEDYVIDFLGGEFGKDVVVAGGFSGHGFKMGPAIGRIVADMAFDGDAQGVELEYFKLARFEKNPKGNVKDFSEQVGIKEADST